MSGPIERRLVNEPCEEAIKSLRAAVEVQIGQKTAGYLIMFIPEDRSELITHALMVEDPERRVRDAVALYNGIGDWAKFVVNGGQV